ncbi:single-stranded DNA-binding protein [bacterium]|nr:single-stranded DNA-binding protein [bacterium]
MALLSAADRLRSRLAALSFSPPVAFVYNPLEYAWEPYCRYIEKYGRATGRAVFLGMNPGPFGMAQTGVPFGEVSLVRDWLGIEAPVGRPSPEHPKRPVRGFACPRSEVSGRRLWGWARDRFKTPERFFRHYFVLNYCPLLFLEESGRNLTPDKLPAREHALLSQLCDAYLAEAVKALQPTHIIGVGGYAAGCARALASPSDSLSVLRIPHPSPANPAANRGWSEAVERALLHHGLPIR